MPDSPILDGGKRFPEVLTVRLPAGFLARIRAAANAEGIAPPDFARRAIAERLARPAPTQTAPTQTAPGGTPAPQHQEEATHHD